MNWIAKIKSRGERDVETAKSKIENLKVAQVANKKIKKVIEQPIVKELFQSDDDLGYC